MFNIISYIYYIFIIINLKSFIIVKFMDLINSQQLIIQSVKIALVAIYSNLRFINTDLI